MKNKKHDFTATTNVYVATLYRLAIVMLLFTACRYIFYISNSDIFYDITGKHLLTLMVDGFKFDLTAVIYLNSLFIIVNILPFKFIANPIYQKVLFYIYIAINSIGLLSNFIDTSYFRFTFKRSTFSVFKEFSNDASNFSLIFRLILDYWYLWLLFAISLFILIYLYKRVKVKSLAFNNKIYYPISITLFCLGIWLSIAGIRGGFTSYTRPIAPGDAGAKVNQPNEIAIVLNTPFSLIRTVNRTDLKEVQYFSDEELAKIMSPYHYPIRSEAMNKKNIVFILIESFGKEYIGSYNKGLNNGMYKGYTPFLDSLIQHSLSFKHSFGNGWKTIDALPSVLASVPSGGQPYVLSNYFNNKLEGIVGVLNREGYTSSFFSGSPNGSMGLNSFVNLLGVKKYYGMNEYPDKNDYDGSWGIWDEEILLFFAKELNNHENPFFASISTLSSHHPFVVPKRYEGVFPKGTQLIHQCVGYTDHALKMFFETAAKEPWYNNTIFAITADHPNQADHEYYLNQVGSAEVPVILFDPSNPSLKGIIDDRPSQQLDIFPTILGYLNCHQPYFAFGNDVLNTPVENLFVVSRNGTVLHKNFALLHKDNAPIGMFDILIDPLLSNNILSQNDSIANKMMDYYRAFNQQFNYSLIHNKTIIEGDKNK